MTLRHERSTTLGVLRPAHVLSAAVVFGVAVAVLKGGDAGMRDSLGNVSAPWLLLPYLAGTTVRGRLRGALMGATACLAALAGFYVAEAFVLDLGDHSPFTDLMLTLVAGRMYFLAGAIFGPPFGALGGSAGRYRQELTALVAGSLLVGEPLAVFAWIAYQGISPSETGMVAAYPRLWVSEMVVGVLAVVALMVKAFLNRAAGGRRPND